MTLTPRQLCIIPAVLVTAAAIIEARRSGNITSSGPHRAVALVTADEIAAALAHGQSLTPPEPSTFDTIFGVPTVPGMHYIADAWACDRRLREVSGEPFQPDPTDTYLKDNALGGGSEPGGAWLNADLDNTGETSHSDAVRHDESERAAMVAHD